MRGDKLDIDFQSTIPGIYHAEIYDSKGNLVAEIPIEVGARTDRNHPEAGQSIKAHVPASALPPGFDNPDGVTMVLRGPDSQIFNGWYPVQMVMVFILTLILLPLEPTKPKFLDQIVIRLPKFQFMWALKILLEK
jgi:hypothetical protein